MDIFKNTLYINLEHRQDRNEHIKNEFIKMGINGERINATKTKDGAIGCTMSHIRCLELAISRNYEYVFICEDDITFMDPDLLKKNLSRFLDNDEIMWDVVIIGGNNAPPYQQVADYCARVYYCQTTTGYIVKRPYYETLLKNFKESVENLIKDPTNKRMYALDMYWKRLQHQDYWYIITPPTVNQYADYSDIEGKVTNYETAMLDMDKRWLFKKW